MPVLVLAAWCGLAAGLGEVGAILARKQAVDLTPFEWRPRQFPWLIPTVDLAIFLVVGMILWAAIVLGWRRGRRASTWILVGLAWLPIVWAGLPRVHAAAGALLAMGLAAQAVRMIERRPDAFRRLVRVTLPIMAATIPILAGATLIGDLRRRGSEEARPMPPAGSPNVLLIVLDTVAADHLHLHGYDRPTSTAIEELAARGIRFDRAQAPASWSLPSHASLFTGRWPHELSTGWFTPLDAAEPTLAGYLGSRGYATAGFVANTWYCGYDSGLARGFATYRDYQFPRLTALRTTRLIDRPMQGLEPIVDAIEGSLGIDLVRPAFERLWWLIESDRKSAADVNREFLGWLSARREPDRPFFAFLNYYDAHDPYQLPEWGLRRFGEPPKDAEESAAILDWPHIAHEGPSPDQLRLARDAYDNVLADLDEEIGSLSDELDRRGILDRTWIVLVSDHGESFGEQQGIFWHGTSLYQPQLHVPMVIVPPMGGPSPRIVGEPISLREIPSTIADVLSLREGSPFPGASLARFWDGSPGALGAPALAEVVPMREVEPDPASWLREPRWPLASVTEGPWTYIRRPEDDREELYRLDRDATQRRDLAADPASRPVLDRMRAALDRLTGGPLTPRRFRP